MLVGLLSMSSMSRSFTACIYENETNETTYSNFMVGYMVYY